MIRVPLISSIVVVTFISTMTWSANAACPPESLTTGEAFEYTDWEVDETCATTISGGGEYIGLTFTNFDIPDRDDILCIAPDSDSEKCLRFAPAEVRDSVGDEEAYTEEFTLCAPAQDTIVTWSPVSAGSGGFLAVVVEFADDEEAEAACANAPDYHDTKSGSPYSPEPTWLWDWLSDAGWFLLLYIIGPICLIGLGGLVICGGDCGLEIDCNNYCSCFSCCGCGNICATTGL